MTLVSPQFCYRIEGKHQTTYTQTFLEGGRLLPQSMYTFIHQNMRYTMANELRIPPQLIHCISEAEYKRFTANPHHA